MSKEKNLRKLLSGISLVVVMLFIAIFLYLIANPQMVMAWVISVLG
jgi:hypothetical protein